MSYDLTVFGALALTSDELVAAIGTLEGLDVDAGSPGGEGVLTVVGGSGREYAFYLAGPYAVEEEDVPTFVAARVPHISQMYTVTVEGSAATGVAEAVRAARALAVVVDGVVVDERAGETWAAGTATEIVQVVDPNRIDTVDLHWYLMSTDLSPGAADSYVSLCERFLPEALPRRYGTTEPLRHKWSVGGREAFCAARPTHGDSVYFDCRPPCFGGSLAPSGSDGEPKEVLSHGLTVDRGSLDDPDLRERLRRFFVALADDGGCFFACAEVVQNKDWDGRELGFRADTERTVALNRGRQWHGLSPYPMWWTWYGPEYAQLVSPHLDETQLTWQPGGGVLHTWDTRPADRTDIALRLLGQETGSADSEASSWLPNELLTTPDPRDAHLFNPGLTPAATMPERLRADSY